MEFLVGTPVLGHAARGHRHLAQPGWSTGQLGFYVVDDVLDTGRGKVLVDGAFDQLIQWFV